MNSDCISVIARQIELAGLAICGNFFFFQYGVLAIARHKSYVGTLNIESEFIPLSEMLLLAVSSVGVGK